MKPKCPSCDSTEFKAETKNIEGASSALGGGAGDVAVH